MNNIILNFAPFYGMSDDKISKRKSTARLHYIYKNPKIEFKNQWNSISEADHNAHDSCEVSSGADMVT